VDKSKYQRPGSDGHAIVALLSGVRWMASLKGLPLVGGSAAIAGTNVPARTPRHRGKIPQAGFFMGFLSLIHRDVNAESKTLFRILEKWHRSRNYRAVKGQGSDA
jgi:hypothetical protein